MDKYSLLVKESALLVRMIEKYKGRYIRSEQDAIRKQADKVQKIVGPEINKAIELNTLFK